MMMTSIRDELSDVENRVVDASWWGGSCWFGWWKGAGRERRGWMERRGVREINARFWSHDVLSSQIWSCLMHSKSGKWNNRRERCTFILLRYFLSLIIDPFSSFLSFKRISSAPLTFSLFLKIVRQEKTICCLRVTRCCCFIPRKVRDGVKPMLFNSSHAHPYIHACISYDEHHDDDEDISYERHHHSHEDVVADSDDRLMILSLILPSSCLLAHRFFFTFLLLFLCSIWYFFSPSSSEWCAYVNCKRKQRNSPQK